MRTGTAIAVGQMTAVVPAVETHHQMIDSVTAAYAVVTHFTWVSSQIEVQTIFAFAETGTIDAVLGIFGNIIL